MMSIKTVRPDAKGRITLGHLADGVSSFNVTQGKGGTIILMPYVEIPAIEEWLFNDKAALKAVKQGIKDAKAGRTVNLGSFAKYAKKDNE